MLLPVPGRLDDRALKMCQVVRLQSAVDWRGEIIVRNTPPGALLLRALRGVSSLNAAKGATMP